MVQSVAFSIIDRSLTEVAGPGVESGEHIHVCGQKNLLGGLRVGVKAGEEDFTHVLLPPEDTKVLGQRSTAAV